MTPESEFLKRLRQEKYADPTVDEVFKELFASEQDKAICIDMLNSVLELTGAQAIEDLTFTSNEKAGYAKDDRKAVVDIHAKTTAGHNVVIEMQNAAQEFFENRILFYLLHTIMEQVPKGGAIPWNYQVNKTYLLSFCNFELEQTKGKSDRSVHTVQRTQQEDGFVWSDTVTEVYVELPKFKKTANELDSRRDLWIYLINHLPELEVAPEKEPDPVIRRFMEKALLRNYTRERMNLYERARMARWDRENQMAYAIKQGKAEMVYKLYQKGQSVAQLAESFDMTPETVTHLLDLAKAQAQQT